MQYLAVLAQSHRREWPQSEAVQERGGGSLEEEDEAGRRGGHSRSTTARSAQLATRAPDP